MSLGPGRRRIGGRDGGEEEEASRIELQEGDSGANPIHIKPVRTLSICFCGSSTESEGQIILDDWLIIRTRINILLEIWRIDEVGQKGNKEIN